MRGVIDPERQTIYIMAGCRDTLASERPYATGNFSRLVLRDKPSEVVTSAKTYAQAQIWLGGRDIARAGRNDAVRIEHLNKAKVSEYAGQNYMNLADCAFDLDERLALYGKATSAFCRAQCYAQLAQDNPTAVERETQG